MKLISENAKIVLQKRFLLRDLTGAVSESPSEMFRRVAGAVALPEKQYGSGYDYWAEKFFRLMSNLKFLPNSPALMNAGKGIGQLAACFVLPIEDSMEAIFGSLKNAALILKSGGGTGFSFSRLRPRSDIVHSTGSPAGGPVSFMKVYNTATDVIKQGGARRGANMGVLRVDHPDILDFIRIKRNSGELENFNISVAVTDSFMEALNNNKEYELVNPRTGKAAGRIKAKTIFDELVKSAWETGDPGIIFIDVINRSNPTPNVGYIESTNPCGEQPLLPYEACILGSVDVSKYFIKCGAKGCIDYKQLSDDIMSAVRFLDNAIDANRYPLPEIELMHKGNRKIGIGIMGWADLLILLKIPYNSIAACVFAEHVMKFIRDRARECSVELAKQRGVFPNFAGSVYDAPNMPRVRNATTTTIAPTGTLSIIADCSSGIEPLFALAYRRKVLDTEILETSRLFWDTARSEGFYSDKLLKTVRLKGSVRGLREVPVNFRRLFRTAHEIHYREHIAMQAAFQKYTDNAVSKTINLPYTSRKEDVAAAFVLAYRMGCKGITVFRYGTRKKGTLVHIKDAD